MIGAVTDTEPPADLVQLKRDFIDFEDVVDQVIKVIRDPLGEWYNNGGRDLLLCAPDVA